METDLAILFDVAVHLTDKEARKQAQAVKDAIAEITLLRAGQFRWIAVSERLPKVECQHLGIKHDGLCIWWGKENHHVPYGVTHWADIPPLPEPTQEEKDKKMFYDWYNNAVGNGAIQAFHAGLKAARGEK